MNGRGVNGSGGAWSRSPSLLARLLHSKVKRHCVFLAAIGVLTVCFVTFMLSIMPEDGSNFEPDAAQLYSLALMAQLQLNSTAPAAAAAGSSQAPVEIWAKGMAVQR
jgi:hypothetical protein